MKVDLTAMLKDFETFKQVYQKGDEHKLWGRTSLLFWATSNTNPTTRCQIVSFLLDQGADPLCVHPDMRRNLLHSVLKYMVQDYSLLIPLCRRLLEAGVDPNHLDEKGETPTAHLIRIKGTEEERNQLYDLWFTYPGLRFDIPNRWGVSTRTLALRFGRMDLVERMDRYVSKEKE